MLVRVSDTCWMSKPPLNEWSPRSYVRLLLIWPTSWVKPKPASVRLAIGAAEVGDVGDR